MEYTYIQTGIKRELMRFGMDYYQKGLSGLLKGDQWPFILADRLYFILMNIINYL